MKRLISVLLVALCLILTTNTSTIGGMNIEEFRALADNRVAVRTSLGVRGARAIDQTHLEVIIGISVTGAAAKPDAYRIISFTDKQYAYATGNSGR